MLSLGSLGLDLRENNDLSQGGEFGVEIQAGYCMYVVLVTEVAQAGSLPPRFPWHSWGQRHGCG